MEHDPPSGANSRSASQEAPRLLRNPNVHNRVHISLPLAPTLSQMDLLHTFRPYLLKIYFNIILSSILTLPGGLV